MKNLKDYQVNMIDSSIRMEVDYDATLASILINKSHPNYTKMYDTLSQAVSDISNVTSEDPEDDCDDQICEIIEHATNTIDELNTPVLTVYRDGEKMELHCPNLTWRQVLDLDSGMRQYPVNPKTTLADIGVLEDHKNYSEMYDVIYDADREVLALGEDDDDENEYDYSGETSDIIDFAINRINNLIK